jgi:uncharacterized protein with FMN-binding domain
MAMVAVLAAAVAGTATAAAWLGQGAPREETVRRSLPRFAAAPRTLPAFQPAQAAPGQGLVHLVGHRAPGYRAPGYRDGTYTGPAYSAYYGWVQVQAIIRHGQLASVRVLRYPSDRSTSRRIAHVALPILAREVIRAQSSRVHAVSGATLTSDAFIRSMNGALRRAAG